MIDMAAVRLRVSLCLLVALFLLLPKPAKGQPDDWQLEWDWMVSAGYHHISGANQYSDLEDESAQVDALLDLQWQYRRWLGLFALKGNRLVAWNDDQGGDAEAEWVIRELFWQESVSVFDLPLDLTLGKVRLDWGVGYGYRPLDVIKPYRRNPVGIAVEEGAGVAAVSYFDGLGEWSWLYSDSSWNSQSGSPLEEASEQRGVGGRHYRLEGDSEYQFIAYYDDVRHGLLGLGFTTVSGMAWSFHGSVLYQRHYQRYQQPVMAGGGVTLGEGRDALQSLIGATWTASNGHQVIAEYWYDGRAWSHSEWARAGAALANMGRGKGDIRMSFAHGFEAVNLRQHNLLLHWQLDPNGGYGGIWPESLTPKIDLLYTPEDSGHVVTGWLDYTVKDTGSMRLGVELAVRWFGGPADSAYRMLPERQQLFLNIKGRL